MIGARAGDERERSHLSLAFLLNRINPSMPYKSPFSFYTLWIK